MLRTDRVFRAELRGQPGQGIYWTDNGAAELIVDCSVREAIETSGLTGFVFHEVAVVSKKMPLAALKLWLLSPRSFAQVDTSRTFIGIPTGDDDRRALEQRMPCGVFLREAPQDDFFRLDSDPLKIGISSKAASLFLRSQWDFFVLWKMENYPTMGGSYSIGRYAQDLYRLIDLGFSPLQAFELIREGYSRLRGGAPVTSEAWLPIRQLANSLLDEII